MRNTVQLTIDQSTLLKNGYQYLKDHIHLIYNIEPVKYEMLRATQQLVTSSPFLLDTLDEKELEIIQYLTLKNLLEDIEVYIEMQSDINHAAEANKLMNQDFKRLKILLNGLTNKKEVKKEIVTPTHNLIYFQTDGGNTFFEKDLKKMPVDYYLDINSMLDCLRFGNLGLDCAKGKSLECEVLRGCRELKYQKLRLFYYILGHNSYLIVGLKHKKDNGLEDLKKRMYDNRYSLDDIRQLFDGGEKMLKTIAEHDEVDQKIMTNLQVGRKRHVK